MVAFDPVAALDVWAIEVQLGDDWYRIPPMPAAAWIAAILDESWLDIVPGWCENSDTLDDGLDDGTITAVDCVKAARDAVAEAAGTLWWTAIRLVHLAAGDAMGELLLAGIDLHTVSLGAVVQAVYRLHTRETSKAQRAKLDGQLDQTPAGVSAEQRYNPQQAANAFEQMAARRGVA